MVVPSKWYQINHFGLLSHRVRRVNLFIEYAILSVINVSCVNNNLNQKS